MRFTPEMIAEDEKRWHARDVVIELGYCSNYMRDRKDMTNLDIRFYAYIMRKAREMLEAQKPVAPHRNYKYLSDFWCQCGWHLGRGGSVKYCANCGREVKWE